MKLLLDTSVIIDFLRQKNKEQTLLYSLSHEEFFVSIVSHTELYAGKSVWEKEHARKELEALFSNMNIVPLQKEISQKAGYIKAHYHKNHHKNSLLDCIIAATAILYSAQLVTLNIKDFQNIEGIVLYSLKT